MINAAKPGFVIPKRAGGDASLTPLLNQTLSQEDQNDLENYLKVLDGSRLDQKLTVTATDVTSSTGYKLVELNRFDNVRSEKTFK